MRDSCYLGDLIDAPFKAQILSHRKNGRKGDRVWGTGDIVSVLG